MKIIVVFWLNEENFEAVIKRDESYTMEEQVDLYQKSISCGGGLYGAERELIEQD